MRTFKNILSALVILLVSVTFVVLLRKESFIVFIICLVIISLFLFNNLVRNSIFFKPYFLSKWNIFTSKYVTDFEFDIPKELMFDKLIEVINDGPMKLKYSNKDKFMILATSKLSWASWGDNIYIYPIQLDGQSMLRFESVTPLQVFDWGKNKNNFQIFLQKLEESLTV